MAPRERERRDSGNRVEISNYLKKKKKKVLSSLSKFLLLKLHAWEA